MKKRICLLSMVFFIGLIVVRCNDGGETIEPNAHPFSGQLKTHSACKNEADMLGLPDTLSCVAYAFDSLNGTLFLTHLNAGFNCCPDRLFIESSLDEEVITIVEHEASALCDCNCLYDLEIELQGIEAKTYRIQVIEPYAAAQEAITFLIDLSQTDEGDFCVIRKAYPWGVNSVD